MRTKTLSTCAAILILSGMPMGIALAQQPTDPRNPNRPGTQERQPQGQTQNRTRPSIQRTRDFTKYSDLHASRVHNAQGETIASVRDLIVDRGTGEIKHVVVRSGSVMGMGGTHVAIPFSEFNWDSVERRLTLGYTEDQIQNMREFDRSVWDDLLNEDAAVNHQNAYQQLPAARERQPLQDQHHQRLRDSETVELTGTVRRIRTDNRTPGSPTTLTIETREHGTVDVLLGPAWYSMGFESSPMRGEQVTIQAAELNRAGQERPGQGMNPDQRDSDRDNPRPGDREPDSRQGDTRLNQAEKTFVARSIRNNRGEVNLRSDDWQPLWNTEQRQPGTTQQRPGGSQFVPFRYVLLDHVVGMDTRGRAEECGEVQTAIIDISGGHVSFLGVASGENILGIGDATYLVPWSIVRVQANGVAVDSSCSQIQNSTPLPDELADLRDESTWQRIFRHFDVDAPDQYAGDMRRPMDPTRDRDLDHDGDRDRDRDRDNRPTPRR